MMIFKKAIPRRAFLSGMGVTITLPLLDAMVPAFATTLDKVTKPALRLSYVYVPNGIMMDKWNPTKLGADYKMTPILKPLAAFRDQFLILNGLNGSPALIGGHPRAASMWLTGADPKKSAYDLELGVSADQVAAKELGKHTQLPSLEVGIEDAAALVGEASGYSAAYTNSIAWRTPKMPLPMEHKPRAVFERLFGDGGSTSSAERLARIRADRSILDFLTREVSRLVRELGPSDRSKITEYLSSIRDVERRIQMAEEQSSRELPEVKRPIGIPPYDDHVKLMFDLQVLAYQTDMTRVITFMMAREKSDIVYTQLGHTEPHHPISHNRGRRDLIVLKEQIDTHHAKLFAYFLEKMRSARDGDGSLLDHSIILYGSGLSDGDLHTQRDLPILVVGGGAGQLKGGRCIRYPDGTPLTNLHLSLLDMAGVHTESLGNSTNRVDINAVS